MKNYGLINDLSIEKVKKHLANTKKYNKYYRFVFLCGKELNNSLHGIETNREVIEKYINSNSTNIKIVLSEKLYKSAYSNTMDLLTFEELLLDISDFLILLVESPGTFTELGAFSMSDLDDFSNLIVINNIKYEGKESFINEGPIKKLKERGAKIIYANLDNGAILFDKSVMNELNNIIKISNNFKMKERNRKENMIEINTFIFELLELINLYQPIDRQKLIDIYKLINDYKSFQFIKKNGKQYYKKDSISPNMIIDFMIAIGFTVEKNEKLYIREDTQISTLLLNSEGKSRNRLRNQILYKRFKNGEIPCINR